MRRKQETASHLLRFALCSKSGADRHHLVVALIGIVVSLTALAGCGSNSNKPVQPGTPALKAVVAAQGNFSSGQKNASYTISVSNTGNGATSGTVTVADPPTGFAIAAISGPGWGGCTPATPTCTRSDPVAAGQSFPPITVTGNVTAANGTPVTIPVTVSGGGTSAAVTVNPTPTVTVAAPSLSIFKTHAGNFTAGQQSATYSLTVQNGASAGATNAKVTVTETVPSGETLVSMSGNGWTCPGAGGANTCDRNDALSSGASYPALSVSVNVAANATSPQVNQGSVAGGGMSGSASANDSTIISGLAPDLAVVTSHGSNFGAGNDNTFTLAVSNVGNASTTGPVTVTDTLDSQLTFVSGTAAGWSCGAAGQSVTCTNPGPIAAGASATAIPLVVAVSASASGTINNTATVATAGDSNPANDASTFSVAITSACTSLGGESLLTGSYALLFKGFDSAGNPALTGGVLTFNGTDNNGLITTGTIDANLNSGVQLDLAVTSGSYGVGADQRGCMVITTSAGTQNYRFSLGNISGGAASTGHVIGFDQGGPFITGILRRQSGGPFSNASASGSFAFGGSSTESAASGGGKLGLAGVVTFDGSGAVTGGSEDVNVNGTFDAPGNTTTWPASPLAITAGTYSISSNGRGTLVITTALGTSNNVLYLVSPSEVLFMSSDPQTSPVAAGEAFEQSGAPFSANPLSGTYVGYDSGLGTGGRSDILLAGPLSLGNNAFNATLQRNDGGTFSSFPFSGTYSVSNPGRMIFTPTTGLTHSVVLYLVSSSQAFFLIGNGSVDSGFLQSQSGSPFSNSSASGTYADGAIDPENLNGADASGVSTFTPDADSMSETYDGNQSGGSPGIDHALTLTFSIDSTGLGMFPSGCSISVTPPTCQQLFYVISPTKAVLINTQSSNPKLYLLDQ